LGRQPQRRGFPQQRAHRLLAQQPSLVQELLQRRFDAGLAFLRRQV
jgi:hypothetical protein